MASLDSVTPVDGGCKRMNESVTMGIRTNVTCARSSEAVLSLLKLTVGRTQRAMQALPIEMPNDESAALILKSC